MGVAVSGWRLARAVSRAGQLGVISGTAMDAVIARRLQDGDAGGHYRRALEHFPSPAMAQRVLDKYFIEGGRAEVESVRGVSLSKGTLDLLLEMDFVRLRGRRRTPGRPVTYATTDRFLEHFSLASLYDLPGVQEMKAAGLLDLSIPVGFEVPDPTRGGESEGEDLLTALDDGSPEFAQDFVSED